MASTDPKRASDEPPEEVRGPAPGDKPLQMISNGLVQLHAREYGRGPTKAKTYILDDTYVCCVMHDIFTTSEETLIERGREDLVRETRIEFQKALSVEFSQVVEQALGRRVLTYQSQVVFDPPASFEFFILGEPDD